MADLDTLRIRGIPFRALVDGAGVAVAGTDTIRDLADEGMAPICQVDGTGTGVVGSQTPATLLSRGIPVFCEVDQTGTDPINSLTLSQLRNRGIPGCCIVGLDGIAQGGSLTIAQLRERGIGVFCPVDENGLATTLSAARITLTGQIVAENTANGTTVGTLATVNTTGTAAFTLVDTAGGRFSLTGNLLKVANSTLLDYEVNQFHTIVVSVSGVTPAIANRTFLIVVTNVLEPVITLTGTTVVESAAVNTTVGTLSLTGSSTGSPTYTLVDSASGTFNLSGATLRTNALLNYEVATSYSITVGVSGINPPAANQVFAITVTNVLEVTLAALTLDDNNVAEDNVAGTVVGAILGKTSGSSLSLTDSDSGRYAISGTNLVVGSTALVAGTDSVTIRETHADGSNSPRDTTLSITVTAPLLAAPDALVLTWTSGPSDNTPVIDAVGDIVENDVIRFQFDTVNTFGSGSLVTSTNTVDASEDAAEELSFTIGALADGTWYSRARIERPGYENSAWSNIVNQTISTAPPVETLNPADKSTHISLDAAKTTTTTTTFAVGYNCAVRSMTSHASGKYFFKAHINAVTSSGAIVGFMSAGAAFDPGYPGGDTYGVGFYIGSYLGGPVFINSGTILASGLGVGVPGDDISIALDIDNGRFWCRINSGFWNNDSGATPTTPSTGLNVAAALVNPVFAAIGHGDDGGNPTSLTVDFSGTGAPSGFLPWGG